MLVRERPWVVVVWSATLVWAASLVVVVRDRYADYRYARFDLGNMVQAVWSTAEGRLLETTDAVTGEQVVRLAYHVDPILALLTPLWMVFPSPLTLAVVQVVAVALGAAPVFWLARRHCGSERTGALLALTYLAYPWIAWAAVDAFHPVALAIPLLVYCVWFLDTDRLFLFATCAVLVAASGELMGVLVAGLGVWYALGRGRRRVGVAIAVGGMGWSILALYVVVPAYAGGASRYFQVFDDVGGSPWGVVRTLFTDPLAIVTAATQGSDFLYLVLLAAPLAGAFLLAPGLAAIALFPLAVNLLAGTDATTNPREHYVAGIMPFLFAAIAVGLGRRSPVRSNRIVVLSLVLSAAATIAVGPWPGTVLGASSWGPLPTTAERVGALDRAAELVPVGAPVSTTNRVGSHLSARRQIFSAPVLGDAEWVVVERGDAWIPHESGGGSDPERLRMFLEQIEHSPGWRRVFERDGVLVFRKARA